MAILGQSQTVNVLGPSLYIPRHSNLFALNFSTGALALATEPYPWLGGSTGSFMTQLGDCLLDSGRWSKVNLVPFGVSATYSSEWAVGGDMNSRIPASIAQVAALGLHYDAILWMNGEGDASINATTAQVTSNTNSMIGSFRSAGVTAPVFVGLETWEGSSLPAGSAAVRAGQMAVINGVDVFQAMDTDTLDNTQRQDGTHFNNTGKAAVALGECAILKAALP